MLPTLPDHEPSPLIKLYHWGRRHQWLAWVWVGGVGAVLIFITAGVFYTVGQMKQATASEQHPIGSSFEEPKKKPVKEVEYMYDGYKYGVGIASIERSKEGAPPGQEKVTVTLQISNRQTDRSAPGPQVRYGVATVLKPDSWRDEFTGRPSGCSAAMIKIDPGNCDLLATQNHTDSREYIESGGQIAVNDTDEHSFDFTITEGTPNSDLTVWIDTPIPYTGRSKGVALPYSE